MILSPETTSLWAKKQTIDGEAAWLPLIAHLIDTQNVITWLYKNWLTADQRLFLSINTSKNDTQKLVKFIGFMHDIGKSTATFTFKKGFDDHLDKRFFRKLTKSGIPSKRTELLFDFKTPHGLAGEALLLKEYGIPKSIAAIIGGHHGFPIEYDPSCQIDDFKANYFQDDKNEQTQLVWRKMQTELFQYGLESSGYRSPKEIPEVSQPQAIILEGLLIMADWLASSEYMDKDKKKVLFPLIPLDKGWQDISTDERFETAMANWSRAFNQWIPQAVSTKEDPYQERWHFKASQMQKIMTDAISTVKEPGMVIAEAPTGSGKTEIALIAAEQLAKSGKCNGVYFALPTQATTDAMYKRVEKWLEFLAKKQNTSFSINLAHSKAKLNQDYLNLPDASGIDSFDGKDKTGTVTVNSWFSGKKRILSQFTVGTIDQLLLMSVKQKHLFLRHLAFSGKVVVIDEVHANDSFMNQHLFKALNWLGAYHVPVIALSATLPKETQVKLLAAYYRGRFGKGIKHAETPENWQETQSYPLLTMLDGKQVKQVTEFGNEQPPVIVKVHRLNQTNKELMNSILNKIKKGGIAGIIVDTIKEAQELSRLVPDDVPHLVLHSAFLAGERASKEATLQEKIGKNGHRPDKMIVIGTQVLEQSLDIDFDVLYTDIAPMDLLLQRIGRLHRHHIQRPDELRQPEVFIMGIEAFGKYRAGISFIYENYLLMKTDYYLKDELTLSTDISLLVQQVYDFESNEEIPDLKKVKTQFETHREKQESEAKAFQIGLPKQNSNPIHGWLKHPYEPQNADEKSGAVVRDISETLEVILLKQIGSEYFTLSGMKISDMSDMAIADQTIRLPVGVTQNMGNVVSKLLGQTNRLFANWKESKWLRESYALVLDQDQSAILDGWQLRYSSDWGLSYEKED